MLRAVSLGALAFLAVASAQTASITGAPDGTPLPPTPTTNDVVAITGVNTNVNNNTPPPPPSPPPGLTPPPLPNQPNQPNQPTGAVTCPQGNQLCSIRAQMFCYNPELLNCVPFQAAVVTANGTPDPNSIFNDNMLCPRSLDSSCNGLCYSSTLLDCDKGVLKDKEGRRIDLATGTPIIENANPTPV